MLRRDERDGGLGPGFWSPCLGPPRHTFGMWGRSRDQPLVRLMRPTHPPPQPARLPPHIPNYLTNQNCRIQRSSGTGPTDDAPASSSSPLPTSLPHTSRSQPLTTTTNNRAIPAAPREESTSTSYLTLPSPAIRNLRLSVPHFPRQSDPKGDYAIEPPDGAGERFRAGPIPVRLLSPEVQAAGPPRATRALP